MLPFSFLSSFFLVIRKKGKSRGAKTNILSLENDYVTLIVDAALLLSFVSDLKWLRKHWKTWMSLWADTTLIDYSPLWETMKKHHISQYALISKGIGFSWCNRCRSKTHYLVSVHKLIQDLQWGRKYFLLKAVPLGQTPMFGSGY